MENSASSRTEAGFATVALVTAVPLLIAGFTTTGTIIFQSRQKLLAQARCVQSAQTLQKSLGKILKRLLAMNRRAESLRRKRQAADKSYFAALKTGIPQAIAAAKAARLAVILAQIGFRTEQQRLLLEATMRRKEAHQTLAQENSHPRYGRLRSKTFYHRPLAVRPEPPTSLSPNYVTEKNFAYRQQHEFSFDLDLSRHFFKEEFSQVTTCSLSLEKKENKWKPIVIAASPQLRRL